MKGNRFLAILLTLVLTLTLLPAVGFPVKAVGDVDINATNFPDESFASYVSNHFDTDKNGILSAAEIAAVEHIYVEAWDLTSLQGIEFFSSLKILECNINQLTSLDLSKNTVLQVLNCSTNKLISLDLSKNRVLRELYCGDNDLTSLDLSNNTALRILYCSENNLTSLDLSKNTALKKLHCCNNGLTALDIRSCAALEEFYSDLNDLDSLNISGSPHLIEAYLNGDKLLWTATGYSVERKYWSYELIDDNEIYYYLTVDLNTEVVTVAEVPAALAVTSLTADKTTAKPGDSITWTAAASGGSGTLRYNFYIYKDGSIVQKTGYTTAKTAVLPTAEAGSYSVKVYVKDGAGTIVTKTGGNVTVAAPASPLAVTGVTADKTAAKPGDSITWTAAASGGTGTLRYNFYIYKDGAVVRKTGYTTAKTAAYSAAEAGSYSVKVYVKDSAGTIVTKTGGNVTVAAPSSPLAVTGVTADKTAAKPGDSITWTAAASGGSGTLRYNFYLYKDGALLQKGSYTTAKTFTYTASEAGSYSVKVYVKDSAGTIVTKTGGNVTIASASGALTVSSVTANKTTAKPGDSITWTAAASGGSGTLRYNFYLYKDGALLQKGSYTTAKTFTYTASETGTYSVKVYVKDSAGTVVTRTGGTVTVAAASGALAIGSITPNKTTAKVGDTVTWTAAASGGSGTLRYCFYIYKDGTVVHQTGYGSGKTVSYTVTGTGKYTAKIFVKDSAGAAVSKLSAAVTVTG